MQEAAHWFPDVQTRNNHSETIIYNTAWPIVGDCGPPDPEFPMTALPAALEHNKEGTLGILVSRMTRVSVSVFVCFSLQSLAWLANGP